MCEWAGEGVPPDNRWSKPWFLYSFYTVVCGDFSLNPWTKQVNVWNTSRETKGVYTIYARGQECEVASLIYKLGISFFAILGKDGINLFNLNNTYFSLDVDYLK